MNDTLSSALHNWIPYKLSLVDNIPHNYWLYTGNHRYTAPFFDETISECLSLPENSRQYRALSSLELLPSWAAEIDAVPPTAFIFHVSRCGSTLLAQLLGLHEQHIVLAETPFLDELLRLPYKNKAADTGLLQEAFPAALRLYGQKRRGDETHLFIKSDSWHLCFYRQLRALYPRVPFILLYRSPDEVILSQRRRRGMQAVQGIIEPEIFGFDKEVIQYDTLDDYMVKVLERYFTIMLEITREDPLSLLLNYKEPIIPTMQKIADFAGVTIGKNELAQMQERSRFHAKYPDQVFKEPASTEALPASLARVTNLYHEVEALRTSS
ncbi:sulfotransferase family protein [Paraflavitalea soli]|uniref:Sulfotransferase family protein n=1 Tax=Paraflavitalea soli TaxID=2315862 RepID=A0A3B7MT06_9BACT|nr:sulfotransferase family protein [Paraflavitalea soli]AXY76997.1 sulfotransferase family protein [Paraflavitalea soli]